MPEGYHQSKFKSKTENYVKELYKSDTCSWRFKFYRTVVIEYLFEQVAQFAFEREVAENKDYKVTTEDFLQVMAKMRPSLTDDIIEEFEKDSLTYSRV